MGKKLHIALAGPPSGEAAPPAPTGLKAVRTRHHRLAALLAQGCRPAEASLLTGFAPATISTLQSDPAFKELLEHYRAQDEVVWVDFRRALAGLSEDALDELRARLRDVPESFTNKDLMELLRSTADRSGHGPATKTEATVNVAVGLADAMDRIIEGEVAHDGE